tara:strand:+ start:6032 stop:6757 length:726 start_codon:yes stop_codon:yes gene_type:complete
MFNIQNILKVDKKSDIKNYAFIYFFRPLSILPTFIFFKLHITPNNVTYFRIFGFLLIMIHPLLNLEFGARAFYTSVLFLQLLDFCDGNLARIYRMESLYGKLIDSIADTLLPFTHLYLIYFYSYEGVNDQTVFVVLTSIFLYLTSQIINNKNNFYNSLSIQKKENIKNNKKKNLHLIRSSIETFIFLKNLYILILIQLNQINFLIFLLLFISSLELLDSLRDVNKNRENFKNIKYSKLRDF